MVLLSDAARKLVPDGAAVRLQPTTIRGATGDIIVHSVRAVPHPGGKGRGMLASLPARAGKAGSGAKLDALVVNVERSGAGPVLTVRLPAASGLAEAGALELEILLPEVPGTPAMAGGILAVKPPEAGRPWRDVDLLVQALPAPLDAILMPFSAWESPLAPDAIPRA